MVCRVAFSLFLLLTISGCDYTNELNTEEYLDWCAENIGSLERKIEKGDYILEAKLQPMECRVTREHAGYVSTIEFDSTVVIVLNIRSTDNRCVLGSESEPSYKDNLYYVSYRMQHDVSISSNGKEWPCKVATYIRNYQLGSDTKIAMVFEVPDYRKYDMVLKVNPVFLETGMLKFNYSKKDLGDIPHLKAESI
jgi:hypothetical protein